MRTGVVVHLSPTDRKRLRSIVDDRNSLQKHVWRARIVLATADGGPTIVLALRGRHAIGALVRWKHTFHQNFHRSGLEVRKTAFYAIVRFQTVAGSQHQVEVGLGHATKPDWPIGH